MTSAIIAPSEYPALLQTETALRAKSSRAFLLQAE
jgi:hypothetical protein